jgi:predicted AAA+ superfamily ATPase
MLFQDELKSETVNKQQIQYYNFEDPDTLSLTSSWLDLYSRITKAAVPGKMNYVFLDEVQNVPDFERLVDGLFIKADIDLYITGSNAYYLSGDLATLLSGRYVEIKMYPLSFSEYTSAVKNQKSLEQLFADYLKYGGFPKTIDFADDNALLQDYLDGIYNTVLIKDVMQRSRINDVAVLEAVCSFMLDNIGNVTSAKRIADTLTSAGRAISHSTVENYISALTEALLFYPIEKVGLKGRKLLYKQKKYYSVDLGLRQLVLGSRAQSDLGHLLENVVFFELLRNSRNIKFGKVNDSEVDFVVTDNDGNTVFYQVAATVRDQNTLQRELTPLMAIPGYDERILLTLDPETPTHQGIKQLNALEWLLA